MKTLICFFTISICFAQKLKFQIRDSITNKPIEFVSINLLNSHGFYSDQFGLVSIDLNGIELLQLSHVSYETRKIEIRTVYDVVYLKPKINQLSEIKIIQKSKKIFQYHKIPKNKDSLYCDFGMYGYELAIPLKIENESRECYLDEVEIPIRVDKWFAGNESRNYPLSLIKINFVKKINDLDSLLCKSEYYFIDKKTIQNNRIRHKLKTKVLIPKDGFFCIITFLGKADEKGNLIQELPTYVQVVRGKEMIFQKYQPLQIPIYKTNFDNLAYCKNYFATNSEFGKVFARTTTPYDLNQNLTQLYLQEKVRKMHNYKIEIGFKYYNYE